jgi:hypothetical protein
MCTTPPHAELDGEAQLGCGARSCCPCHLDVCHLLLGWRVTGRRVAVVFGAAVALTAGTGLGTGGGGETMPSRPACQEARGRECKKQPCGAQAQYSADWVVAWLPLHKRIQHMTLCQMGHIEQCTAMTTPHTPLDDAVTRGVRGLDVAGLEVGGVRPGGVWAALGVALGVAGAGAPALAAAGVCGLRAPVGLASRAVCRPCIREASALPSIRFSSRAVAFTGAADWVGVPVNSVVASPAVPCRTGQEERQATR